STIAPASSVNYEPAMSPATNSSTNSLIPISFVQGTAVPTNHAITTAPEKAELSASGILLSPVTSGSVAISGGALTIKQGAIVYAITRGGTTAVLNLHDNQKESVTVEIGGEITPIHAGQAV